MTSDTYIPTNSRSSIIAGLVAIVFGFGGFVTWASVAPIQSAVIASAVITVESHRKQVQHREGGIIKQLNVRDGDVVDQGDVLIVLDKTHAKAALNIHQKRLDSAQALEVRLLAERDETETILFPASLLERADDPNVSELISGQRKLFKVRKELIENQRGILEKHIRQLKREQQGIEAQITSEETQLNLIIDEVDSMKELVEKGFVPRQRFLALQREAARLEGSHGEHIADLSENKVEIETIRLQISQLREARLEEVVTLLRQVREEILHLHEEIDSATHTLSHIEIRSPVKGTVVGTSVHTIGGVIKPGDTVLEVVPSSDALIIEAKVKPNDIDNISLGQRAEIEFNAFKRNSAPTVLGSVDYISADRFFDESNNDSYFKVRMRVPENELDRLSKHALLPGMTASVFIITGERTAFEYITQPIGDSLNYAWREE